MYNYTCFSCSVLELVSTTSPLLVNSDLVMPPAPPTTDGAVVCRVLRKL